ncbi:MAG: DNA-protecting protein DprA [Oscillospiraceae bacterium]|nr:DNA-protecting protein DprA [Oscillospiraceae bacterium]
MNILEECVLLLCCRLGDPKIRPLTMPRFKELGLRVLSSLIGGNHLTELRPSDLCRIGYPREEAEHIIDLLDRKDALDAYLAHGETLGIYPITRVSEDYPSRITKKQSMSRPPSLFVMGDASLLEKPAIAVVGSRDLQAENERFARAAGRLAAEEGYILVSGGARGADTAAQEACLEAGGKCMIFVAGSLQSCTPNQNILYISEDGYDIPFSAARALHRNSLIHIMGEKTLAAQCTREKGGTWQGCTENLKRGWSDLFVFDDGSEAMQMLMDLGATGISIPERFEDLQTMQTSLF